MSSSSLIPTIPSSTSRILTHSHSPTILPHFRYSLKLLSKCRTNFRPSLRKSHPPRASPVGGSDPSVTNEPPVDEARAAISDFLRDYGVSQSDADEISLKSPRFLKMVVDGVSELEELSLWGSWGGGSVETMSFKEKVGRMMEEKGDGGKVAFLESIGLSLSSAMNVSRYLSSETLPNLILKVKSMKEIFASDRDDDHVIGRNALRMMTCLSIPVDDDIQQVLSFFEKIAAKRGGLEMLGSKDASFRYLIESFPRILLLSVEFHIKPMAKYLESIGVPQGCLRNVLLVYPPIIFYNIKMDISPRLLNLRKIGAADKDFGKMLIKYPWIMSRSIQENYESILYLFETYRVPKESVDRAVKSWPHLLGCSTVKLRAMVECFIDLGVNSKKLGQVIASCPQLLLRKPQDIAKVVLFFEELAFDKESVGKTLGRCPEIFAAKIDKTLSKKLKFLKSIGLSKHLLPRLIKKYPEVFVSDIDKTIIPRMKYLTTSGLSKREVAIMVHRFAPILGYSIDEVLKPKLEFLVTTMEKPVSEVVEYPRYFSYSLEKKIKPRFRILKGRKIECSLKDMLAKNDEEFAADFMGISRILIPPPLPPSS
uniref:Uncharacterized protein n=1 Tax=Kalanchoe fedtschenkoi TaxID=63787 RepID=A0A7N0TXF2_KALFE